MGTARTLMEHYWISKDTDKELYRQVKQDVGKCRRFFTEQLGWNIISNERILKVEKIPAHAESFMGITTFRDVRDYCIFCGLLIFLEDKEDHEQFLLSELVALIDAQLQDAVALDWTLFTHRKSLVRVLKFAEEKNLLKAYDGSSERVRDGIDHEVLYENTGLSRYFATNFGYSIGEITSYKDFEQEKNEAMETDRGHFRINRVYRQMASAPAMYWNSTEDQDALYLKNQRQWVGRYLKEHLGGRLEIHKNAAFFVVEEDAPFGECHPREMGISEVTLGICGVLREMVEAQLLSREADDRIRISNTQFREILQSCKERLGAAWSKEYREMTFYKLEQEIRSYMVSWMLAEEEESEIFLLPAIGKITGFYPSEFLRKIAREEAEHHG